MFKIIFFSSLLSVLIGGAVSDKKLICYVGTWATYRPGLGKFDVANIHPDICSHLVYTFVGISDDGTVISLDPYLDLPDNWGRDNFGNFNALKEINPELKTILAVGGWNEGSAKYSNMANDPICRKRFIDSALSMLLTYGFDGFDVDWEYPNQRDSTNGQTDVDNFTLLLKELKEAFQPYGLLLTAAVVSVKAKASVSYDIPAISQYLDLISIMTYDMYGAWDPVTGHNAPLYRGEGDENVTLDNLYTVDAALQYWLEQGAPPEKLLLGVPLYGRTFTLANENNYGVRAAAVGGGNAGPYTRQSGILGYNEICPYLNNTWNIYYDAKAEVPYAVNARNWLSYDESNSLTLKTQYALNNNLAGIMVWSLETDDFHGLCHGEDYHLLRTVNGVMGRTVKEFTDATESSSSTVSSTTPISSSTASSSSTVTTSSTSASSAICQEEGFIGDPHDCSVFYFCLRDVNGNLVPMKFNCPNDLLWDETWLACNYPNAVDCQAHN